MDGDFNLSSAAELKELLLEGLASGKELQLDLQGAGEIDITVLQLLWAAGREAERAAIRLVTHMGEGTASVAREAGFEGGQFNNELAS